jgi:hypothetical protein
MGSSHRHIFFFACRDFTTKEYIHSLVCVVHRYCCVVTSAFDLQTRRKSVFSSSISFHSRDTLSAHVVALIPDNQTLLGH